MREILFRGKRTDNGEWVEGDLVHSYFKVGDTCINKSKENLGFYQVDPATVGQYTGFYDKEGKKIFEGDILRFRHGSRYPVFWDADCGAFGSCYYTDFDILSQYNGVYDEVIGNIHDNPELLKGVE